MGTPEKKILIAEDEQSLRDMLVIILEDENFQAHAARDGAEAWDLLNSNHYDLLLTDQFMPKMNGFELIKKCQESFPDIKTILSSGGGSELEAEHGKSSINFHGQQLTVDTFLKKPCKLDEIISTVELLLRD